MATLKRLFSYLFFLRDYNLNLDKRERHWLTFILFDRIQVTFNDSRTPLVGNIYFCLRHYDVRERETHRTWFFFAGRLTVTCLFRRGFTVIRDLDANPATNGGAK